MKSILKDMGEGIMLKDPKSAYENTRSDRLLKILRANGGAANTGTADITNEVSFAVPLHASHGIGD